MPRVSFLRLFHLCCFSGCITCVVSQVLTRVLFLRLRHDCWVVSQVVVNVFCFSYYDTCNSCIVLQVASYVLCFSGCDTCVFFCGRSSCLLFLRLWHACCSVTCDRRTCMRERTIKTQIRSEGGDLPPPPRQINNSSRYDVWSIIDGS